VFSVTVDDIQKCGINMLTVIHDSTVIAMHTDRGEPEDNSFFRDYSWIAPLLEKVYRLGIDYGLKNSIYQPR